MPWVRSCEDVVRRLLLGAALAALLPKSPHRLQAVVGCPTDCGDHGRCALAADATAPACQCECSWFGAACDVPSGFCSRYPSETTAAAAVCPATAAPVPDNATVAAAGQPCVPVGNALHGVVPCADSQTLVTFYDRVDIAPGRDMLHPPRHGRSATQKRCRCKQVISAFVYLQHATSTSRTTLGAPHVLSPPLQP